MITLMKSFPGTRRGAYHVHYYKIKGITYSIDMRLYRWKTKNSFYYRRPIWIQKPESW